MKTPQKGFLVFLVSFSVLYGIWKYTSAQQQPVEGGVISVGEKVQVRYTAPWAPSAAKYRTAVELVVSRKTRIIGREDKKEQEVEYAEARCMITVEPRASHADALKGLSEIVAERDGTVTYREIASWPGLELTFREELQRRGKNPPPPSFAQRAITAVAVGDKLVRFEILLAPDSDLGLLRAAQNIARDVRLQERGNPAAVKQELEKLKAASEGKTREKKAIKTPAAPRPSKTVLSQTSRGVGVPVKLHDAPIGELEVAVSKDTRNIVIASNSGLSFSINRGDTFRNGNPGVTLADPSLARGVSGHFYLSVNGEPTDTTGCTIAVSQSIDKGENFQFQGFSVQCLFQGPICFPDQAHIAADSVTATTAGKDQLYAVWRHWNPSKPFANCGEINEAPVPALISCSMDNGANWTVPDPIPGAGDFPRVAVGSDGSVYVVRIIGKTIRLNRFKSCANGLIPDLNVTRDLTGTVSCPVPGLDRCNDGNTLSSPTVAPDPKDANHLFVAFAERDMTGGERIVVAESRDRGLNFPLVTTVSGPTSARRFMPWACSTNGDAWVGWYDRRAATFSNNDLTDYFIGSAKSTRGTSPSLTPGTTRNLTNNPDPQCASRWFCSVRNAGDSEFCSSQPQKAGICSGSGATCDFSAASGSPNGCPAGEICRTGGGCPKYGDYNGIACMDNFVFAAWASATAPAGMPPVTGGIRVFASTEQVGTSPLAAPTGLQLR